ncbi:MAG: hypothetical protein JWP63_1259 [Candidatus Solibacter sp.]|jgi:hypothetical protein|nr:hypothetical protein [Candidatus Solibacter sp.]
MLRDDGRVCDGCGQKLPPMAMLGQQTMSKEEAREYGSSAEENADGMVTIDLCLGCRIQRAERMKGR